MNKLFFAALLPFLWCGPPSGAAGFDGDGRANVFLVRDGQVHRYKVSGRQGEVRFIRAFNSRVTAVCAGDLDNDGLGDLFVGRSSPDVALGTVWYEARPLGGHSLGIITTRFASNVQPNGIAIGSNSDGSSDLYLLRSGGALSRYRCESDNRFAFSDHNILRGGQCLTTVALGEGGSHDLLVGLSRGLAWYRAADNRWAKRQDLLSGLDIRALAAGPADSDGFADLFAIVERQGVRTLKRFRAVRRNADVLLEEVPVEIGQNAGFSSIAIGDLEGDGGIDLLAAQSDGPVRWFQLDGRKRLRERPAAGFGLTASGIAISSAAPPEARPATSRVEYRHAVGETKIVTVGDRSKAVTVTASREVVRSSNDLNFPQFRISQAGTYAVGYGTGHHGRDGWHWIVSTDGGETWTNEYAYRLPGLLATLERDGGHTVSMSYGTRGTEDPTVRLAVVTQSTKNWLASEVYPSVVRFSFALEGFAFARTMLPSADGERIYAVGHRAAKGSGAMMLESEDLGLNWSYRSTIAERNEDWMGRAGPSETAVVRLTNGQLLAVMRTGATSFPYPDPPDQCPMAYALSADDGATWTPPRSMNQPGVLPDMGLLPDGTVILLSGRPGVYIRLASPDGGTWSEPVFLYGGAGCANSSMQIENGQPVIVYTESDFCGDVYSGHTNVIKLLNLRITDAPSVAAH